MTACASPKAPPPSAAHDTAPPVADRSGVVWETKPLWNTPLVMGQAAIFVDLTETLVVGINAADGFTMWGAPGEQVHPTSLAHSGDVVFFSQRSGKLTAVKSPMGEVLLSRDLGCAFSYPVVHRGVLAGMCTDLTARPLRAAGVAVDATTGQKLWEVPLPEQPAYEPGYDDDTFYFAVGATPGIVVAVDRATGAERWRQTVPGSAYTAAAFGATIVVQGFDTYGLRRGDGSIAWTYHKDERHSFWLETSVLVARGQVLRPHDTGIDCLDPATGSVVRTLPLAAPGARPPPGIFNGLWVANDTVYAHLWDRGGPGHLLRWDDATPRAVEVPKGTVAAIVGDTVLMSDVGEETQGVIRGFALRGKTDALLMTVRLPYPPRPPRKQQPESVAAQTAGKSELVAGGLPNPNGRYQTGADIYLNSRGEVHRLSLRDGKIEPVAAAAKVGSRFAVDRDAFYFTECGTGGCREHKDNQKLVRLDRKTGVKTVLADGLGLVMSLALDGASVYMGYWADDWGMDGGIAVVPKGGGALRTLWKGDTVRGLWLDGDRLYFIAGRQVGAVKKTGGSATVLARGLREGQALALDATHVYFVDRGDLYWASKDSGSLQRVSKKGGKAETLMGPVRWPVAVAVDSTRAYALFEKGELWAAPKTGGAAVMLATVQKDDPCPDTAWIGADGKGILWLRHGREGQLWRVTPR
jgi:outer membrane protein assembly factor BamB